MISKYNELFLISNYKLHMNRMIEFLFIFILQASVKIPFIQELIPQQFEERVYQDIQIKESRVFGH